MNLTKTLAQEAKHKGICNEWYRRLKSLNPHDKRAMVDMYLRGIDFCLRNEYPSNGFIKANFGNIAHEAGIFVDEKINVLNAPKCVCLGATKGKITVMDYAVCEVFAKHDSELNIIAKGHAFVMVDIFDNAIINIHTFDSAKVCVNRYGGTVKTYADKEATIKIREKNKKTY